jgi:broad specificity phosphatase PhoE
MERLEPQLPQEKESEENPELKVDIFRHGESTYKQRQEVPIEEAKDLTPEGEEKVRENAEILAETIGDDEEVEIWSSPTGRTLHTARIISETFEEKGIKLRKKGSAEEHGIKIWEQLNEVHNFSWVLFEPLMNGGEVEFVGEKFNIDKNQSNPLGLGYPEYFTSGAIKEIPEEVKNQWPKEYVEQIEGFESFIEVTQRMMKPLERLKKLQDKNYRVIIVTHDALTGFIANVFTAGEESGLDPGSFINLERKDGKLIVTKVGDRTEGESSKDVIEEFKSQN